MPSHLRFPRFLARPRIRTRVVVVLWVAVAGAVAIREGVTLTHPMLPGEPWDGSSVNSHFLDFRDTIWTPGRFLWGGGNPYDPDAYRAVYPWALSFSLYAPVWLILAAVLAPLPYLASIVVFQVLSLGVAILMLNLLFRWTLPRLVDIAVPIALLWMNVWAPGRGALEVQLTTLLAVIGAILVLRSVCAPTPGVATYRNADRATAWGVALSLMKPQFGTTAVIGLAAGRFRGVAWGVAGLALTSLPMLIVCTVAAGGPVEFVRSVMRDLAVATSDHHPSGLMFPDQRRLDLLGQIVRWGTGAPPSWLQIAVPILFLVVLPIVVVRLTRRPLAVSVVTCTATLLGIYHGTYDVLILLIPVAVGLGMAVHGELTRAGDRIALVACLLVVLHLQTVSTTIVPGLGYRGADAVNLFLMLVGLIAGLHTAIVSRRNEEIPYSEAEARTGSTEAPSALSS